MVHPARENTTGLELLVGPVRGVQVLRLVFSYFQALLLNTVGQYVMFDMRRELYDKLQHQEVAYYDRNPVGRIMTRLTSDVDSLNELFTAGITDLLGDLVMIVAIIGDDVVDGRAADAGDAVDGADAVCGHIVVSQRRAPRLRHGANTPRPHQRFSSRNISPARRRCRFSTPRKSRCEKFQEINADYRKANIDTIFYYAVFFPLVDFIGAVGIALIIWYGGYRVMQNTPEHTVLTLGALVAFIQYSGFLFQPIRDISDKYNVLQAAVVASHRIFKTLDLPIAITSSAKSL